MSFERTFLGAPWEKKVGYCRALRVGNQVHVSGTAPIGEDGNTFSPGDGYAQARRCLEIIEKALKDLGAEMADVVRTRMYVTDFSRWEEYGKAHREFFENHPPTTTLIEIKSLVDPEMLIEIEAEAAVVDVE